MLLVICFLLIGALLLLNFHTPLILMITVILQTLLTCLMLKMILNFSWFSMLLFLIFIGGLLILFMYIVSLASNEPFMDLENYYNIPITKPLNYTIMLSLFICLATIMVSVYIYTPNEIFAPLININLHTLDLLIFKIYSPLMPMIMFLLVMYLLLVLLVSVYIISFKSSSLRSTTLKS